MSGSAERMRAWEGPAVLGHGFRPLFLGAGLWAALAIAIWVAVLSGRAPLPTRLAPVDWHVHELLYGYLPAVVAGFLLTAVPNWTGRLPVVGWPLLGLVAAWIAGRIAMAGSAMMPAALAAAIDLAFLGTVAAVAAREIVAGRNWRNLVVLVAVLLLWLGNLVFHIETAGGAAAGGWGARLGIAVAVFLILLIGGRIVPSFTRNWLVQRGADRLPAPMGRFDGAALGLAALALIAWLAAPEARITALACLLAGAVTLARLWRWGGWRTAAEPLVLILHLGYLFAPLGFFTVAAAILAPNAFAPSAALHAWTAGAVGVMTLAVMTRASLGHTGRALTAGPAITAIYAAAIAAALLRVAMGLAPGAVWLLHLSAGLWLLAFGTFSVVFFAILTRPRARRRQPSAPAP